jgi:hypothetical protein
MTGMQPAACNRTHLMLCFVIINLKSLANMRATLIAGLIGLLLPAAALAQTMPPQTAAIENTASAPAPAAPMAAGGITRDEFIQRAKERAGQRAAARFDKMDTDHDGRLDRAEIRAWRSQHPRHAAAQPAHPTAQ